MSAKHIRNTPGVPIFNTTTFVRRMTELNNLPISTDFTILCNGKQWNVHRLVLAAHSDVLAKACTSDFIVETKEGKLDLSEHGEDAIDCLAQFLYSFEYKVPSVEDTTHALGCHVRVAVLSDKYNMPELKSMANAKFAEAFPKFSGEDIAWDDLTEAVVLAYEHRSVLRDICIQTVRRLAAVQQKPPDSVQATALEELLVECPSLAIDVFRYLKATIHIDQKQQVCQCPSCRLAFWDMLEADSQEHLACLSVNCGFGTTESHWATAFCVGNGYRSTTPGLGDWWKQ